MKHVECLLCDQMALADTILSISELAVDRELTLTELRTIASYACDLAENVRTFWKELEQ